MFRHPNINKKCDWEELISLVQDIRPKYIDNPIFSINYGRDQKGVIFLVLDKRTSDQTTQTLA
jgi:hypothetical protein